jgi:hypothetical protein
MDTGTEHPVVAAYLAQLDAAGGDAGLSAGRRAELRAEIRAHVDDALAATAAPDAHDDTLVIGILDRLGPIEDIVAAEIGDVPRARPRKPVGDVDPAILAGHRSALPRPSTRSVILGIAVIALLLVVVGLVAGRGTRATTVAPVPVVATATPSPEAATPSG